MNSVINKEIWAEDEYAITYKYIWISGVRIIPLKFKFYSFKTELK